MIVCNVCGSRNIRQEATIMLNPNDNTITIFDNVGDDLYWNDFYSFDYVKFWEDMLNQFPTLCVFGYTAREDNSVIGSYIQFLNIEYRERFVIRFSRSKETKRIGKWFAAEETFTGPSFTCPEQTGKLDSCASCGLCWTAQKTVRFLSH